MILLAFSSGLFLGLGLIVAIGPQNLYVLQHVVARRAVKPVIMTTIASDMMLIALGVLGLGQVLATLPTLAWWLSFVGCLYLAYFAFIALHRVYSAKAVSDGEVGGAEGAVGPAIMGALGFSLLNPSALIDTVVLLGAAAGVWGEARGWFALGAMVASAIWFSFLAYGGTYFRTLLVSVRGQRILYGVSFVLICQVIVGLVRQL